MITLAGVLQRCFGKRNWRGIQARPLDEFVAADRGEGVPKVMNADIVEAGRPADALQGSGQNIRTAFLAR
jgi:hypothetical protein